MPQDSTLPEPEIERKERKKGEAWRGGERGGDESLWRCGGGQ